jgi:hypothetical protein
VTGVGVPGGTGGGGAGESGLETRLFGWYMVGKYVDYSNKLNLEQAIASLSADVWC